MIVTVTPNPAVDKTLVIDGFKTEAVNRATRERIDIGGKGINVARNLACLGCRVVATGFLDARDAYGIVSTLATEAVKSEFVEISGAIRVNLKILDSTTGAETEINELGPRVTDDAIDELGEKLRVLAGRCSVVVFSGSLPPGAPDDLYARYIHVVAKAGARTILDTAGAALRYGIAARPDLIKPNRAEAEELLDMPIGDGPELIAAARLLLERGPHAAVISLGAAGALSVSADGIWLSRAPEIAAQRAVGAGDGMVAALASALSRREPLPEALRLATAFGSAAAASATRVPSADEIERLLPQVLVESLSPVGHSGPRSSP